VIVVVKGRRWTRLWPRRKRLRYSHVCHCRTRRAGCPVTVFIQPSDLKHQGYSSLHYYYSISCCMSVSNVGHFFLKQERWSLQRCLSPPHYDINVLMGPRESRVEVFPSGAYTGGCVAVSQRAH
jgi:hypothetical protein